MCVQVCSFSCVDNAATADTEDRTLVEVVGRGRRSRADAREEVAEVMLPCPCNGGTEAVLSGLCEDFVVDLEGQVALRLECGESLFSIVQ